MGLNTGLYMVEQRTHYVIKRDDTNKKKKNKVRIHGKKKPILYQLLNIDQCTNEKKVKIKR